MIDLIDFQLLAEKRCRLARQPFSPCAQAEVGVARGQFSGTIVNQGEAANTATYQVLSGKGWSCAYVKRLTI